MAASSFLPFEDVTCPVCFLFAVEPLILPCQHFLCSECWLQIETTNSEWRSTCPMCRAFVSTTSPHTTLLNSNIMAKCNSIVCGVEALRNHAFQCNKCAEHVFTTNDIDNAAEKNDVMEVARLSKLRLDVSPAGWVRTIANDAHNVVEWLISHTPKTVAPHDIQRAICHNAQKVLAFIYPLACRVEEEQAYMELAIAAKHIDIVAYLWDVASSPITIPETTMIHLIQSNEVNLVMLLWTHGAKYEHTLVETALKFHSHELVRFFLEEHMTPSLPFWRHFMHNQHLPMIDLCLHHGGVVFTDVHIMYALHTPRSHLVVNKLVRHGVWAPKTMEQFTIVVASLGRLDVLQYMWDTCDVTQEAVDQATRTSSLCVLNYLIANDMIPSKQCFHEMIERNNIVVVDLLMEIGMKPDESVVNKTHNLDILKVFMNYNVMPTNFTNLPSTVIRFLHQYLCASCPNLTNRTCSNCGVVRVCSAQCEEKNKQRHRLFCQALSDHDLLSFE